MLYESVIVFDSNLSDSDVAAQLDRIEAMITSHSGQVSKRDVWGRRQLAYKIKKKEYGIYAFVVFSGANTLIADMRRQLRINDSVLRFLVVKKDKFAPDLIRPPVADTYGSREGGFRDPYREPFRDNFYGGPRDSYGGDRDGSDGDAATDGDAA